MGDLRLRWPRATRIPAHAAIAVTLLQGLFVTTGQAAQTSRADESATKASPARIWKSETTGNEYRVHIEGDTFRADWTNLPRDFVQHGAYVRTECRRVGSKWIGTTRSLLPCSGGAGPNTKVLNWCPLVTRTEINTIQADRITGRAQAIHSSDCQSCKVLEAVWKDFVWAPKR
jgi:hypothetical protein